MTLSLEELQKHIEARKTADPDQSYVGQLHAKGLNKILEKVGEESVELILASRDYQAKREQDTKSALIGEAADLWFHTLVLLSHLDLSQCDIMQELEQRFGRSGLEEKASRKGRS